MNLVDSCGWLEYFTDGPNAGFFAPALEDAEHLLVPSLCILEVFKKILQERGEGEALRAANCMHHGHVVDLTSVLAMSAARIAHQHKLPLADSVIAATARLYNATIWTQDEDFKDFSHVKYIAKKAKIR